MSPQRVRVVAVTVALVLGSLLIAGPASAASLPITPTATPPVSPPPASSPRAWILNVLGSVLGGAMPNSWKAEQLANQSRYNFGWETLEAQFGTNAANPDYMGSPDTYDDYVIRKQELQINKPFKAPATKLQSVVKTVGVGATVVTGLSMGLGAGQLGMALFGVDVDGLVCSQDSATLALDSFLTGADCDAWSMTQEAVAQANADASAGLFGPQICSDLFPGNCVGPFLGAGGTAFGRTWYCLDGTLSGTSALVRWYVDGSVSGTGSQWIYFGSQNSGSSPPYYPGACDAQPGTTMAYQVDVPGALTGYQYIDPATGVPEGAAVEIVEGSADPERTLVCTITGTDGIDYTLESDPYHESDGSLAPAECPVLPEGVGVDGVSVSDSEGNELWSPDMNEAYQDWWETYPECRTGACKLDIITLSNPEFPVSCFDLASACDGWFESPTKTDDYECHYGIHTVDLSECNVYSGVFSPARLSVGAPYSDPMTGVWSGGESAPRPDSQAFAQDVQSPNGSRACNGLTVGGLDPVGLILRPIQCALEWAFVPRATVVQLDMAEVAGAWSNSFFGEVAGLLAPFSELPIYTGCSGVPIYIEFDWPQIDGHGWVLDWNFGEACSGPLADVAVTVRAIAAAGIILGGIRTLTWYIGGVIGYRGFGKGDGVA